VAMLESGRVVGTVAVVEKKGSNASDDGGCGSMALPPVSLV
jgi:hypothetical protein